MKNESGISYDKEVFLIGPDCREQMMDSQHYPVLKNAPFIWLGHSVLYHPYRMVRPKSVHSHLIVSISGRGRTLIDGKLVEWKPGQVMLGPVGVHHAFEVDGDGPWEIAWVFFDDEADAPVLRGKSAQLIESESSGFVQTLKLLLRESAGDEQPAVMEALVTLLNTYARRMLGDDSVDPRLLSTWIKVEADLAYTWDIRTLSNMAHMSEEHFRRLCKKHYQRSPIEHLTHLRMRRAATMLKNTSEKLEEIARNIGYASMYSFSVAFKRWSGMPPRNFRYAEK
jgi:AraC-like DNA-binding protein